MQALERRGQNGPERYTLTARTAQMVPVKGLRALERHESVGEVSRAGTRKYTTLSTSPCLRTEVT